MLSKTAMSSLRNQTINLAAGPSPLPTSVLEQSASSLLDFSQTGMGILELSHRGSHFSSIISTAEKDFRKLLDIPDNYKVLWMQGGGTGQFSAVVMNLLAWFRIKHEGKVEPVLDYLITGSWSKKAAEEARMLGAKVNVVCDGSPNKFTSIPDSQSWKFSPSTPSSKPAFTYICDNETVHGLEFDPSFPFDVLPDKEVPLVADMSSNILSRKFDVSKYGVVYAGAQKNMGPAGITVVIVREDLIVDPALAVPFGNYPIPSCMSYHLHATSSSLHNTPPTFAVYVCQLVFQHLIALGGVDAAERNSEKKSNMVYDLIDGSDGFYIAKVAKNAGRSRMNVTFTLKGGKELEEKFVKDADLKGIKQIKGHRSVGGIRTSLYNAVTVEQVKVLCDFMKNFQSAETQASEKI